MQATLEKLGLSKKEAKLYLFLIKQPPLPASEISRQFEETRTNTYMLLDALEKHQLIIVDSSPSTRTYAAVSPSKLRILLTMQQKQLKETQAELAKYLPQLDSLYRLNQHRPGVIYFEGLDGFSEYQDDIAKAQKIDIFGSNEVQNNPEAWKILQSSVKKRYLSGTKARMILHQDAQNFIDAPKLINEQGYNLRFWNEIPFEADIVIYDGKVGFTSYQDSIITTVISNNTISTTFGVIFEAIWQDAQEIDKSKS